MVVVTCHPDLHNEGTGGWLLAGKCLFRNLPCPLAQKVLSSQGYGIRHVQWLGPRIQMSCLLTSLGITLWVIPLLEHPSLSAKVSAAVTLRSTIRLSQLPPNSLNGAVSECLPPKSLAHKSFLLKPFSGETNISQKLVNIKAAYIAEVESPPEYQITSIKNETYRHWVLKGKYHGERRSLWASESREDSPGMWNVTFPLI